MKREVCCQNFKMLISYIRKNYGQAGIKSLLQGVEDNQDYLIADKLDPSKESTVKGSHLTDPSYWISYELTLKLMANARRLIGGINPLYHAGESAAFEHSSKSLLIFSRIFGFAFIAKRAQKMMGHYNKTKEATLKKITRNSAVFEITNFPEFPAHKDICNWLLGVFAGTAKASGAFNIKAEETSCITKGDPHCIISLTWDAPGIFTRLTRKFLKSGFQGLISEYENTLKDRTLLIERLAGSEQKYRNLYEEAPHAYFSFTPKDGKIIRLNRAACSLLGYSKDTLIGRKFTDLILSNDMSLFGKGHPFYELNLKANIRNVEVEMMRKDGYPVWVSISMEPLKDENSDQQENMAVVVDISQRKQLENQLRQAHKMESIGTLAGGIAHDFNNILSPIMLHTELATMQLPSDSPLQHNLSQIYKGSERARDLVRQILTISHKGDEKRIPLKITPLIKESLKMLRSSIPTTVEILKNLKAEQDIVLADPTQIHQIMLNLCTNSAHAMKENGGTLSIELFNKEIEAGSKENIQGLAPGKYIKLIVKDSGKGIDAKTIQYIFEPYFTTKGTGEGTGLGLALVHGIVKSCEGNITVESEPGKGTGFEILLPVVDENVSEHKEPLSQISGGSEHILFVDDELDTIKAMKTALENLGYSLTIRSDSLDALEYFRNNPRAFDIVITDMTMPNMTGKALAVEMIAIRPDIPIILCTGFSDQISEPEALKMGIKSFIFKPITINELSGTIRKVLDQT